MVEQIAKPKPGRPRKQPETDGNGVDSVPTPVKEPIIAITDDNDQNADRSINVVSNQAILTPEDVDAVKYLSQATGLTKIYVFTDARTNKFRVLTDKERAQGILDANNAAFRLDWKLAEYEVEE